MKLALSDPVNGWWIAEVLAAFAYLGPEFGYRLDEVFVHFRGSFVRYAGPTYDLVVDYDPEDTGRIDAALWSRDDFAAGVESPRGVGVSTVLRSRDPWHVVPDPRRTHLTDSDVHEAISLWAAGLRDLAPDVLRGAWPEWVPNVPRRVTTRDAVPRDHDAT